MGQKFREYATARVNGKMGPCSKHLLKFTEQHVKLANR